MVLLSPFMSSKLNPALIVFNVEVAVPKLDLRKSHFVVPDPIGGLSDFDVIGLALLSGHWSTELLLASIN